MDDSSPALVKLESLLSGNGLLIYCGLIAIFILVEMVLIKDKNRKRPGGQHAFTNFALLISGMALLALFPLGTAAASLLAAEKHWGLFNLVNAHWSVIILVAILAMTFTTYWLHRALHGIPLLWKLHRIHHTDTSPDLSTGFRHHPVETLVMAPVHFAAIVACGLPLWAALLANSLLLAGSLFKHLDGSLPPALEKRLGLIVATPGLHRYHHSAFHKETDSNFGNLLIIWDRLFGTITEVEGNGPKQIGLGPQFDAGSDSFLTQFLIGFRDPEK